MSVDADGQAEENLMAIVNEMRAGAPPKLEYLKPVAEGVLSSYWKRDKLWQVLEGGFDKIDGRFDAVDGRFDAVDERLDAVDGRLDRLEAGQVALQSNVSELKADVSELKVGQAIVTRELGIVKNKMAMIDTSLGEIYVKAVWVDKSQQLFGKEIKSGQETLRAEMDQRFETMNKRFVAMEDRVGKQLEEFASRILGGVKAQLEQDAVGRSEADRRDDEG